MTFQDIKNSYRELRINGRHRSPEDHSSKADTTCLNCSTVFKGNFCPTCGQNGATRKLTIGMAIENLLGVFTSFDRGFMHTLTELLYRPGHMIRDYLEGHRVEYIRPIQLLFLMITIIVFLMYVLSIEVESIMPLNIEFTYGESEKTRPLTDALNTILSNLSFLMIATSILTTLPNYFSFRLAEYGKTLTLSENFHVMIYISCLLLLWRIPFLFIDKFLFDIEGTEILMDLFLTVLTYKQLLRVSIFKALSFYLLSALIIILAIALVATVVHLLPDFHIITIKDIDIDIEY